MLIILLLTLERFRRSRVPAPSRVQAQATSRCELQWAAETATGIPVGLQAQIVGQSDYSLPVAANEHPHVLGERAGKLDERHVSFVAPSYALAEASQRCQRRSSSSKQFCSAHVEFQPAYRPIQPTSKEVVK
jgi:hypothetical protein